MSYSIETIPAFDRQIKRLAKKYKSVKTDLQNLVDQLRENPELGIALGQNCYKIRLAIKSKGKGKSGGSRVVTYVHIVGETVFCFLFMTSPKRPVWTKANWIYRSRLQTLCAIFGL